MSNVSLSHCLGYADRVEQAVLDLRVTSGPLSALPARCAAFRNACETLATRRGLARVTVGFVGPRNAGKTTLASQLIHSAEVRARLPVGDASGQSTRKILWIGPERPPGLEESYEAWIPCSAEDLVEADMPYQLADVPGFNDRVPEVRSAAEQALTAALVKVLVVDERELEALEVRRYLAESDGAVVVPVVNRVRQTGPEDLARFVAELRAAVPQGEVLEPILVPDFRERDRDEAVVLDQARQALLRCLRQIRERHLELSEMAVPQMRARFERFRAEVRDTGRQALPAAAAAVQALNEAEEALPRQVLADALGSDRVLRAMLRQRIRSLWLDNTPALFFPWRAVLGLAHLVWGALDRIPLMLLGSLPSLVSAGWAAARNVRRAADFREATTRGLERHLARRASERLAPLVHELRESLDVDLGRPRQGTRSAAMEAKVEGVAVLQERSTAAIEGRVERHAPGPFMAVSLACIGCVLFWGVAAWPLYALYQDYFHAALGTWFQAKDALRQFPAPSFSLVLTTGLLGLLPLGFWLVAAASWVTRSRRVHQCAREIEADHERIQRELLDAGLLRVRMEDAELAGCRVLLGS